jgi:hypothetical protein
MRYICAQPATNYYTWQVEVLINNFLKNGVNPNKIDILCAINNNHIPQEWIKLQQHYNTVRFFFYNDTRPDKSYIPSVYFNLMSSHMKANPELVQERLFLHDSDIVFTRPPELGWAEHGKIWYMSDTNSYINYDYVMQKGEENYEKMCEIVGLDKTIPKLMNSNSGGAQYIIIGEDHNFWDKVERDSVEMYRYFCQAESTYKPRYEGDPPIQKWTAGMWALLWNAWKNGHETKVDWRLDFGWATHGIDTVQKHWILHNAGVMAEQKDLFYKANYMNKLPYNEDLQIREDSASMYYWQQVQEAAKVSVLLR